LFARFGGQGIAANPKVVKAAFSDEVKNNGYNSEAIELGENHVVVLRVKDKKPAEQKPYDEVKDQIKAKLIATNARTNAKKRAEELLKQMQQAESSEVAKGLAAKDLKVAWKSQAGLTRNDTKVDRAIVSQVFKTAKPSDNKPQYGMVQLNNGDVALFVLTKVVDGDPSKMDAAKKTSTKGSIARNYGSALFSEYLESVKSKASISKFEDRL